MKMADWSFILAAAIVTSLATSARAEHWVSLGGNMNSEVDLDTVAVDGEPYAWIRTSGRTEQGILTTYFKFAALCGRGYVYLLDGQLSSSWSSTVMPMPDLPEADRMTPIPAPNVALNNLYEFLCKGRWR